jgi:hypothetical protein
MGNVIRLCDRIKIDPVLRKGDTVRIVDIDNLFPESWIGDIEELEGAYAIVTEILMVLPDTHEFAPGQAAYINLAVPFEEEWHEIEDVSIEYIHRVIGDDFKSMHGYESE